MQDYASRQRKPTKHLVGLGLVVVLHLLLLWAINSGLARSFVKKLKGPVEAVLLEEQKPDIPPPPPPPPPPRPVPSAPPRGASRPVPPPPPPSPFGPPPDLAPWSHHADVEPRPGQLDHIGPRCYCSDWWSNGSGHRRSECHRDDGARHKRSDA